LGRTAFDEILERQPASVYARDFTPDEMRELINLNVAPTASTTLTKYETVGRPLSEKDRTDGPKCRWPMGRGRDLLPR